MTGRRGAVLRVDAVGAVVCVGVLLSAVLLARAPVEGSRARAGELASEVAAAGAERLSLSARADRLRERAAVLEGALERTRVELKPGHSVNRQIARIADLAEETRLRLAEVRPEDAVMLSTHTERPVVLRGRAPFAAVVAFVREVEERFVDLGVRSMVVVREGEEGEEPRFELRLVWFADRAGA